MRKRQTGSTRSRVRAPSLSLSLLRLAPQVTLGGRAKEPLQSLSGKKPALASPSFASSGCAGDATRGSPVVPARAKATALPAEAVLWGREAEKSLVEPQQSSFPPFDSQPAALRMRGKTQWRRRREGGASQPRAQSNGGPDGAIVGPSQRSKNSPLVREEWWWGLPNAPMAAHSSGDAVVGSPEQASALAA